jgi:hypothetical protein
MSSRVIQVIETTLTRRGKGKKGSPVRVVRQYWSFDGTLLAEVDSFPERRVPPMPPDECLIEAGIEAALSASGFQPVGADRPETTGRGDPGSFPGPAREEGCAMTTSPARFTELHREARQIARWLQEHPWIEGASFRFSVEQNKRHVMHRDRLRKIQAEIGVTTDEIVGTYGSAYWSGTAWVESCPECRGEFLGCTMPGCVDGEISVDEARLRFRLRRGGRQWLVIDSRENTIVEQHDTRGQAIVALGRLRGAAP